MRQIYVITLFFLPYWCFSQLYIQPNGNNDSYMYVEGALLYVQNEIDLQLNNSQEYRASIYLRDEAQLIQGNEHSANKGNGQISVFQEAPATAHTYNYWGSPVEVPIGDPRPEDILYEPLTKTQSRPVTMTPSLNGKAYPLQVSNRWLYKLNGREYEDWVYIGQLFKLKSGEGFTMKGVEGKNNNVVLYGVPNNPGNQQRYDFRGRPHTGTISLPINRSDLLLMGNPYPSALDLNTFLFENNSITGIAYFWDSNPVASHYLEDYEGGYGAYSPALGIYGYAPAIFYNYDNSANPTAPTGTTGNYYARRFSPVAQGFIVEGLRQGLVSFRNRHRVFVKKNPVTSQFKSVTEDHSSTISLLRINIQFDNNYTRQLLLAFHPNATQGVDRAMDAKNLMPLSTDAGWWLDDQPYVTVVKPPGEQMKIPLAISTSQQTQVTIKITDAKNINRKLYLLDAHNNIYYELSQDEIGFNLQASQETERFYITFNPEKDELSNLPKGEISSYLIFQNNEYNRAEILAPAALPPEYITIYDSAGRKIISKRGQPAQNYYEISTASLTKGMYIIKIISTEGVVISKKVIISN